MALLAKMRKQEKSEHRLAVVEEVADHIYSVKFILQSLGYEVGSFAWTENYLERIATFRPGLVIVDMMIPRGGGYKVLEGLHGGPLSKIPVLAITAAAMQGQDEDVLASGGHDLLQKPYSISDLQMKLKKWLPEPEEGEASKRKEGKQTS